MASLCLSAPITAIVALKPIPSNPNQINLRNSLSFSPPLAFNPLRCSSISTKPRFSSLVSMASSSDKTNEPLWKSLGKSVENFGKKPSVEDLLRQQIEKQEYYDEGGGGGNPPGGRGGGGGGDGLGGSEEEGFGEILDETIQVILATLGFIFMYVYIINGAEMTRLAKDYLSFLFGGRKSIRLTRAMYQWERFWKNLTAKKERDRFWLEKAIINTPTWWDSPEKYMLLLKALSPAQPRPDANEEDMRDGYDSQGSEEMGDGYY
ncbi:uncharacterized protein LOC141643230 [Silene latifolia]|uniref:uncharacterized protein LOC141643230 n=1 Tax=Silene latifolia TaxID=37657 RepID=UPI003D778686